MSEHKDGKDIEALVEEQAKAGSTEKEEATAEGELDIRKSKKHIGSPKFDDFTAQ